MAAKKTTKKDAKTNSTAPRKAVALATLDAVAFERYLFLRLCAKDFDDARDALDSHVALDAVAAKLDAVAVEPVKHAQQALLRDAVVSYCRPFSGNRSRTGLQRLSRDSDVPTASHSLHDQMVSLRHQLFAHSDLTHHKPKIMGTGAAVLMTFQVADYHAPVPQIADMRRLAVDSGNRALHAARKAHTESWFASKEERMLPMGSVNLAGRTGNFPMTTIAQVVPV